MFFLVLCAVFHQEKPMKAALFFITKTFLLKNCLQFDHNVYDVFLLFIFRIAG